MTIDLPEGGRTIRSGRVKPAETDERKVPGSPDGPGTERTPKAQRQDTSNLRVAGFVDTFRPPNFLSGWAKYEGGEDSPDPLDLKILLDGEVIGTGQTGDMRRQPAGRCGFSVTLSRPITMTDIRRRTVKVYAMDASGAAHELPMVVSRLLRVRGFVDSFKSPNVLSGWARQESSDESLDDPLDVRVLLDGTVIGSGQTGEKRASGGDGFRVTLSRPIAMTDIRSNAVKVYAIDVGGEVHELPIWPKLLAEGDRAPSANDWPARLAEIERLIGRRSAAASKPYRTDGIVLAPACTASELRCVIESEGLHGFLPHLSVPAVLECLDRDRLPIPRKANRELYYGDRDAAYWLFGLDDYLKVKACWEKYFSGVKRILDFGGSTGRVFRHFYCQGQIDEVYACDCNRVNIQWCKTYFPPDIRVFLNSFYPGLPFADGYFDVITAFSVFTHIDDFEDGWLLELSRLLRPGGIAYITIHDEAAWAVMPSHLEKVLSSSPGAKGVDFEGPMPFDRMVFPGGDRAPHGINVFHRQDYVRHFWDRYFRIEEIIPQGHHFQTVLVLRNEREGNGH